MPISPLLDQDRGVSSPLPTNGCLASSKGLWRLVGRKHGSVDFQWLLGRDPQAGAPLGTALDSAASNQYQHTMNTKPQLNAPSIMRPMVLGLMASFAFAACNSGPSEGELAARAETERLKNELIGRDSLIGEMALSFDDIEKNIALMDDREKVLGQNADGEMNMDKRGKIVRDLQLMNGLMQESRERIADLTKRLDKSKIDAGGLRKKLKELDLMLASRDSSIATMKDELLARDFKIEQVNSQLTAIELEVVKREAIIEQQTNEMNTAWYVVGTSKELEDQGVVTHTGGLIGIGKTAAVNGDVDNGRFKTVDVRQTSRVPLGVKKAHLVTEHPKNSYTIVEEGDELAYLEIKDPAAFWRMSKYMVVEVK